MRWQTDVTAISEKVQDTWKAVAKHNGGIYHCWYPPELETIIQVFFPWLWPLYSDQLRFPHIQRVDIGRICILILCGGMYIDLDVMPNRIVYYQVPFAVCRIDRTEWMEGKRKTRRIGTTATSMKTAKSMESMMTKTTPYEKKHRYDLWFEMEAIIANPRNPVLTRWLMFVVEKGKCTEYDEGFYKTTRGRYVMYTTGPNACYELLRQKCERGTVRNMRFIACNVQKLQHRMTTQERAAFDVVSYDRCSWINQRHYG